jgi:hypothetical protein
MKKASGITMVAMRPYFMAFSSVASHLLNIKKLVPRTKSDRIERGASSQKSESRIQEKAIKIEIFPTACYRLPVGFLVLSS